MIRFDNLKIISDDYSTEACFTLSYYPPFTWTTPIDSDDPTILYTWAKTLEEATFKANTTIFLHFRETVVKISTFKLIKIIFLVHTLSMV